MYGCFPTRGVDVGADPAGGERGLVDLGGDFGEAKTCLDVGRCDVHGYLEELREGGRGFRRVQPPRTLNSDDGHAGGSYCVHS